MYKVICICKILGEEFSDILDSVVGDDRIQKYDFNVMDSIYLEKEKSKNFREIQRFDTLMVRMVRSLLSACSYKLNDFKQKKILHSLRL